MAAGPPLWYAQVMKSLAGRHYTVDGLNDVSRQKPTRHHNGAPRRPNLDLDAASGALARGVLSSRAPGAKRLGCPPAAKWTARFCASSHAIQASKARQSTAATPAEVGAVGQSSLDGATGGSGSVAQVCFRATKPPSDIRKRTEIRAIGRLSALAKAGAAAESKGEILI